MKRFLKDFKKSLLHLIYPSKCIHCHAQIAGDSAVLCSACGSLLELLNPNERCEACFFPKGSLATHCPHCAKHASLFFRTGAAFPYLGPAASIIQKMKYGGQPHLAKGAGAFLIAQFVQLNWPLPDAIIPVPLSISHWFERGFNQSSLLAHELAAALQVPVWEALKRTGPSLSQAGLTLEQRKLLSQKQFKLKNSFPLADKTLLLIDDVTTSGSTLQRCAEVLYEKCPQSLYALTLCKAE